MERLFVLLALAVALIAAPVSPAHAGEVCCVCTSCATGPSTCIAPGLSCDIVCPSLGCPGFSNGSGQTCVTSPSCLAQPAVPAQAPALGRFGLLLAAVALSALGVYRVARRRA